MHFAVPGMPRYLSPTGFLLIVVLCIYVTWQWVRCTKLVSGVKPKWRVGVAVVGLCLATFSTILSVFLLVHASYTGGYPFYHPVELFCIRFGFSTAFLGLVASIMGKGKLRGHVAVLSILNLLLWVVDAMAQ
jgi:hypothetical protein